ncbi:hypothetical protein S40288_10139 [Stachybotrys chartarum IBT 40288]|nr:hypothetical protein S40288_10139 [Stachybotrys chartarum IBT 40288]
MGVLDSFKFDWRTHKRAVIYCLIASIGALLYGYDNTYYNGVLAMQQFKNHYGSHRDEDGNLQLPSSFQSMTASAIYIGDLFGALSAGPINDRWGRKVVFWIGSTCILLGGVAQVADTNHEAVISVGRAVMGLGVGQFTVTTLLYIGEVAPAEIRGPALMSFQFLQSISQLVASAITQGTEGIRSSLSYKIPMGGLIILPLLLFAGLPFIPESPMWYYLKGRSNDAEKSLRQINASNQSYDPADDLASLDETKRIEEQHAEESSWKGLLSDPIERRKLFYSCGAMACSQICGILFFYVYGVVFAQAIGVEDPFVIQLVTNILQIFAVGASVITGNKVARRTNLFITNSMMLFAFIVIGGIGTQGANPPTASTYIIVIFSYFVIIGYNYGIGPLAYTIAREMAIGTNQNKIMSASIVVFYFVTWAFSFTAPYMYYDGGLGPMIGFVYAGTTSLTLLYTWFCVGETAGRSTTEISRFFTERVPVRQWKTHVFESLYDDDAQKTPYVSEHETLATEVERKV